MVTSHHSGSEKARNTLAFLRARIADGTWPVGELIPKEPELMELIGVGKSTVREAVRSLATLGMLKPVPGVGTYVRARTPGSGILADVLSVHDVEEVLIYRRSLEIEAAQSAAIKRTDDQLAAIRASYEASLEGGPAKGERCHDIGRDDSFHRLIVEASGSRLMLELYTGVMRALNEAMSRGEVFLGTTHSTMLSDHGALYRAIEERSVRDAAHAMALHADRDLGLNSDMLDFSTHTERAETLIDAGFGRELLADDPDVAR